MNVYISNEVKTMGNVDYDRQKFVKEGNSQALHLKGLIIGQQSIDGFLAFADKFYVLPCFVVMFKQIPASIVVKVLLPAYKPTLPCLLVLLPTLFPQAKNTMIYNTILKIQRRERTMMTVSFAATVCCVILTFTAFKVYPSLITIAACTTCSYFIWQILLRHFLAV